MKFPLMFRRTHDALMIEKLNEITELEVAVEEGQQEMTRICEDRQKREEEIAGQNRAMLEQIRKRNESCDQSNKRGGAILAVLSAMLQQAEICRDRLEEIEACSDLDKLMHDVESA
jgi:hypothetical protein